MRVFYRKKASSCKVETIVRSGEEWWAKEFYDNFSPAPTAPRESTHYKAEKKIFKYPNLPQRKTFDCIFLAAYCKVQRFSNQR